MKNTKTHKQQELIWDALDILKSFGIGFEKVTERAKVKTAMAFLALTDMHPGRKWSDAKDITGNTMKTREIIDYENRHFGEDRSSGSYDDVRRKELMPMRDAGIVLHSKPDSAMNNPSRGYGVARDYCEAVRKYKTEQWDDALAEAMEIAGRADGASKSRTVKKIPIDIPDRGRIYMSLGNHNELHKKIIGEMMPRFCKGSEILYIGDAAMKQIINETVKLKKLGFFISKHGLLPDIIAYSKKKNTIYLIEAVYSSNPFSKTRKMAVERLTKECSAKIIYISAFDNMKKFKSFVSDIAWETEAWIAGDPDHMIHFNGDKFLG